MGIKETLLNILFTKRCHICGNICDIRYLLCENCAKPDLRISGEICYKCGLEKENCNCDNQRYMFYDTVCAPFHYSDGVRLAVFRLKFRNRKSLADNLATEMANCVKERYCGYDFDICTFMPSHEASLRERGYNHAELLAKSLSDSLGITCIDLIKKDFETPPQHNLPLYRRTGNLAGALSFKEDVKVDISGMRILLCDDIKTSGKSLDECAKILLFNGAAEVKCITLCIAGKDIRENF